MITKITEEHLSKRTAIGGSILRNYASLYLLIQVSILLVIVVPFINRPYWDDELFSVRTSSGMNVMLETFRLYENNMALYYWMLLGWIKLFGISEIATRSLSLVFAVCSISSYYRLGSRFFSPFIVFLSGFVLTMNPLFLVYSVEARSYSLLVLLAIVATNLFFSILDRKRPLLFLLYGLTLSASIYTHYFAILILPVHVLAVFFWKGWPGSLKYLFATWFLVVLSVIPMVIFPPSSVEQVNWMSAPTVKTAMLTIPHLFGSISTMLLIMGLWFYYRAKQPFQLRSTGQDLDLIAWLWIFLPVGLAYLVSVLVKPVFMDRYFLGSMPATALLTAHVLSRGKIAGGWVHWLLLVLLAIQGVFAYRELDRKGSGFRDLTAYIVRHANNRDMVVAYPFFRADHFMHFLRRESPGGEYLVPKPFHTADYLPGGGGRDPDPDLRRLDSMSAAYERTFLICNPEPREADGRQNRIWQPEIEKILSRHYARRDTIVFRPEYSVPLRLIIYSK